MTQTRRPKVLIVDDEPKLVRLVKSNLVSSGYDATGVLTAADALEAVANEFFDLVILDVALPDKPGFEVCQRIREFSEVPVIMLTAKSRECDKLEGFHSGADDYITKPFSSAELIARVRAILKRSQPHEHNETHEVTLGDVCVNFVQRRVYKGSQEIRLTNTEYNLLKELASNSGKVMLHADLLRRVWGSEYQNELEYLRAYIRHLRRKIEDDPSNPTLIQSIPGVGYSFGSGETVQAAR